MNNPEVKESLRQKWLNDNPAKRPEVKEKISVGLKNWALTTHGVENAAQVPEIASLVRRDISEADVKAATGKLTPTETRVVDEARAAAPAHISSNIAPSAGTPVVPTEVAPASHRVTRIPGERIISHSDTLPGHLHPTLLSSNLVTAPNGNLVDVSRLNADGTPVYTPNGNLIRDVAEHNRTKSWLAAERAARRDGSTLVTPTNPGSTDNPNYSDPVPATPDANGTPLSTPADASASVAPTHIGRLELHPAFSNVR
jgi:hypothetical protein